MEDPHSLKGEKALYTFWVYTTSTIGLATALTVITGWLFKIPILLTVFPGLPSMKFNTAICIAFSSIGVGLMQKVKTTPQATKNYKWLMIMASSILIIIGATTFATYFFSFQFNLDQFFVENWLPDEQSSVFKGRMTSLAALSFLLIGLAFALFLSGWQHRLWFIQSAFLIVTIISAASLVGYLYGIPAHSKLPLIGTMALHTSLLLFALSICAALIHHQVGFAGLITGKGLGNTMAKKIIVRLLMFGLAFGFFRIYIFRHYQSDEEFSIVFSVFTYFIVGFLVVWHSASEVNRLEEKRTAAELDYNLMHVFIKEAPTAIAALDNDFKYIAYSKNWVNDYKLEGMNLIGKSHYDIFPEIGDDWKAIHQRCLKGETLHADEDKFVRADGTVQWLKWETRPWRKSDGTIGGMIMSTLDITNMKEAQEAIIRNNQKIEAIMDAATRISIIATNVDGVITTFSKGAEEMLGYSASEMLGKQTPAVLHDAAEVKTRALALSQLLNEPIEGFEVFVALARKSGYDSGEWTYIHKNGRKFPVQLVVTPIRSHDGSISGFLGIASDITEQKAAEAARAKFVELEAKNREMEQFTYIASHDLQEPLKTISNFTSILNQRYQSQLDESGKQILTYLNESATRMTELVRGLLFYARIGTERKIEKVNFNEVVSNVCKDLSSAIAAKQAIIKADKLPELPAYRIEINQLFQNLISNAIKFCEKGKSPVISISAKAVEHGWRFSVQDNGIGIPEKDREKIFLLFRQLHNRGVYEGTGIGLAFCKKIVALHGGNIKIDDAPGGGTIFSFTINPAQYEKA